jgi:hypothetical protein
MGKKDSKENLWTEIRTRVWRKRSNVEIQNMYKSPDIVTEIKVRRLEWLGHVRMEDTRLPKMVFSAKPEGRCGVGRRRPRWLDDVEADVKVLGVKRWRIKAQDTNEWSAILWEAKAKLKGPWSQRRRRRRSTYFMILVG